MKSLQQSTSNLDSTRRKILYDLLKDRHKNDHITEDYLQQEIDAYLESLKDGIPMLTPKPQTDLTDADAIDQELSEYEIDIHSIYHQLNHISQRINQHQKLNESILNDVKMKIRKVDEKLQEYNQLLRDKSAHAIFLETFIDSNSLERDHSFYTERDGTELAPAFDSSLDVHQNALRLPVMYKENAIINFSGLKLAQIKINKQLGSGFIRTKNPEHSIDKAFDTSMETMWNETILTDAPLEVDLGLDYYGLDFGAVCEMEIDFDYISRVNEITFMPFVEYPVEIVAIIAYQSDRADEEGFEIVSPTGYMTGRESTDVISYQFPEVVCKRLKIIINQKHYIKEDIIMEIEDQSIVDAWLNAQGFIEIDADKIFKPVYQDKFQQEPHWFHLGKYLKDKDIEEEIEKFKSEPEVRKIQMSKYEYQYGFYNIAVGRNEFHNTGIYVTHPITNQNIHRASLETIEKHPILPEVNIPVTSIEYYFTDKERPSADDWRPVLPTNIKEIYSERLTFTYSNGRYTAMTRFSVKNVLSVRQNGRPLTSNVHYTIHGRSITLQDYDLSSIYTIDYIPEDTAYYVDFLTLYSRGDQILTRTQSDQFSIEGQKELSLSRYPFIDKVRINAQGLDYNPSYLSNEYLPMTIQLTLPDGQRIEQPVSAGDDSAGILNTTNYFDPKVSLLEPFTGSNYQYRIVDNKVTFNTELPKGTLVNVQYPYLTGPIRMKAIMRRNLHEVEGLTPFLHEYKTIFQSLI